MASWPDAWTTSTGSSRCGGVATLHWVPPRWTSHPISKGESSRSCPSSRPTGRELRWGLEQRPTVKKSLAFCLNAFFQTTPVQSLHHCPRCTNPPVNLLLHSSITCEHDSEMLKLLHLRQDLTPNPERAFNPFPTYNHSLRFGGACSHPCRFTLGFIERGPSALAAVVRSQQDHIICRKQRGNPDFTNLEHWTAEVLCSLPTMFCWVDVTLCTY